MMLSIRFATIDEQCARVSSSLRIRGRPNYSVTRTCIGPRTRSILACMDVHIYKGPWSVQKSTFCGPTSPSKRLYGPDLLEIWTVYGGDHRIYWDMLYPIDFDFVQTLGPQANIALDSRRYCWWHSSIQFLAKYGKKIAKRKSFNFLNLVWEERKQTSLIAQTVDKLIYYLIYTNAVEETENLI